MSSDTIIITLPNLDGYDTPQHFAEQLAHFATNDDRVLGIVLRNHIDKDYGAPHDMSKYFGYVVMTRKPEGEVVDDVASEMARDLPVGIYRAVNIEPWHGDRRAAQVDATDP